MKEKTKTLTIKHKTWGKLSERKVKLDCTFDDLIDRMLKKVPLSELKGDKKC